MHVKVNVTTLYALSLQFVQLKYSPNRKKRYCSLIFEKPTEIKKLVRLLKFR